MSEAWSLDADPPESVNNEIISDLLEENNTASNINRTINLKSAATNNNNSNSTYNLISFENESLSTTASLNGNYLFIK